MPVRIITVFATAALLSSCAAVVPHTLQTPLVQQRGETELSANIGLHGTDVQAAHALTNRLTLTASGHQRIRPKHGHWAYTGEAGAGYGWSRVRHQWAIYGGLGYGAGYVFETGGLEDDGPATHHRVRYGYGYLQPTFRFTPSRNFGLGIALKVAAFDLLRWRASTYRLVYDPNDPTFTGTNTTTVERPGFGGLTLQPGYNLAIGLTPHLQLLVSQSFFLPLEEDRLPPLMYVATGLGLQCYFGGRPKAE
ncbi:hypothetical protein EJV47_01865 [Hymenobacter gummosus]|uniref:Outer membrane protein beta-barrel domain-containing protein n=1 Tax=Hymenobacter gummosus TaxID=1776032 RepID=A0A3S0JHC3_9BACT|nr:hypothetical protein [Hymenobacter gummosus]RTQ53511.1 hypothetical protein EJV47_01865 [Hymenobacter gummosus]